MPDLFTFSQRLGILFTVEASVLSAASVTFILCYALYRRLRRTIYTWNRKDLRRPSDATSSGLFLNLMVADLLQAIGSMPNIKWMTAGAVLEGRLCTSQAVLKQIGIVGVSMTSLAIALHTFSILVLRWKGPQHLPKYAIVSIWAFTALVIGIPNVVHRHETYYGSTGYWCWILPHFKVERIVTEYLWVWLSGFFMIILYGIMFAVIRGWFIIDHGIHWYNNPHRGALNVELDDDRKIKAIANSMLYYPAVYIFCVLPNTLARWLSFSDFKPPPYQATLFASSLYGLSGLFNLILFFITRPTVVVGTHPAAPKDVVLSISRHHDSTPNSSQKKRLSDYDYGILSTDIEKWGRLDSNSEPKSPSRTVNRPRSSYDLQGVGSLPSSPTRNTHYREAPIPEGEVLDID